MNPANNEVLTLGYFVGQDFDLFHVDFGLRLDQVTRIGSVTDEDGLVCLALGCPEAVVN
jgi:hypothetical protein